MNIFNPIYQKLFVIIAAMMTAMPAAIAQNPFLPLWEFIPDGEPHVFEDPDKPGEYRVYVYGSHDSDITRYCGVEQVVWSAPVGDLHQWRYDGVSFRNTCDAKGNMLKDGRGDLLYAPDVCEVTDKTGRKTYYLYPNNQEKGREGMICKSDRPDGPFVVCNWDPADSLKTTGVTRFDPAVLVDDDGRVYAYWGINHNYAAELDPTTMCTVKPGTKVIEDMIPSCRNDDTFRFFEASSIRKIKDKYVFIYSRWSRKGEWGMYDSNYTLAYAYSDHPLGPWTYGGTLIDGRARHTTPDGHTIATATPWGNTHGSIFEAEGQWWLVYHRQTNTDEYSRQAMACPLTVNIEKGKGGKVTIREGEYTSEGFTTEGLNPFHRTPAALACYYTGPEPAKHKYPHFYFSGSYVASRRVKPSNQQVLGEVFEHGTHTLKHEFCTVMNNTSGSVVGYKYFRFDKKKTSGKINLEVRLVPAGIDGTINILCGGPSEAEGGKVIATIKVKADAPKTMTTITTPVSNMKGVSGKQPVYFRFSAATKKQSLCEFVDFCFK